MEGQHPTIASIAVAFLVLAVVFGVLERCFAAVPGFSIWRRDRVADFLYWFFTPLVTRVVSALALAIAVGLLAALFGFPRDVAHFVEHMQRVSPFASHGQGAQLLEALVIADFFSYWQHRLFHERALWKFHAVHHSAVELDWLAATRLHPFNDAVGKLAVTLPLLLFGFHVTIFAAVAPLLTFWAIFQHANVKWGFGPLKYVVATPLFHRWHHTSQDEGLDKNFAGLFPFWDMIFGTFYLPAGRQPTAFGAVGNDVPDSFLAQLAYPFRAKKK